MDELVYTCTDCDAIVYIFGTISADETFTQCLACEDLSRAQDLSRALPDSNPDSNQHPEKKEDTPQ